MHPQLFSMAQHSNLLLLPQPPPTLVEVYPRYSHRKKWVSPKKVKPPVIFPMRTILTCLIGGHLPLWAVVLISMACALGCMFIVVIGGLVADKIMKKRAGYTRAPTYSYDRQAAMSRMPPEQLFGSIGQGRSDLEKRSTQLWADNFFNQEFGGYGVRRIGRFALYLLCWSFYGAPNWSFPIEWSTPFFAPSRVLSRPHWR